MWPDQVTNPGPLALESDALPTAVRGPAQISMMNGYTHTFSRHFCEGVNIAGSKSFLLRADPS